MPRYRDVVLPQFLYNTGARAQEVATVRLPAVRLDAPAQVRLLHKGRKERLCPVRAETTCLLHRTLKDRGVDPADDRPLLLNANDRPLTRFGLRYIVRSCVAAAARSRPALAKTRISPHTFRHTTALHLLQAGVELNVVRSWLGHASIETTHGYVEIDLQMKRAALDACQPPNVDSRPPSWTTPDLLTWLEALRCYVEKGIRQTPRTARSSCTLHITRRCTESQLCGAPHNCDFDFNKKMHRALIYELATGRFIQQREDALFLGPPGTGQSHLAKALGYAAIQQGYRVCYREAHGLQEDLADATLAGTRKALVADLTTVPLLIIDDLGMRKLPHTAAEDLLEIIRRRCERASTLITSNRPVDDWGKLLGDTAAVTELLDRLLHHAHVLKCGPRSWRTRIQTDLRREAPAG